MTFFFLIRAAQIILMCRLLTQNREHNLKNATLLDENDTCIQDSRMAKYILIEGILI